MDARAAHRFRERPGFRPAFALLLAFAGCAGDTSTGPEQTVGSVTVVPASTAVRVGDTVRFTATAHDGSGKPITRMFVWASSDPAAAEVSGEGLVNGLAVADDIRITASADGVSGTATVQVTSPVVGSAARIAAGEDHTCGIVRSGIAAYCWGPNNVGQLGDGTATDRHSPVAVSGGITFSSITVGAGHACGLTPNGAAYCWGWNSSGQIGDGTTTNRFAPVAVSGGLTFASIAAGFVHTCGLSTDGVAYCWGGNSYGSEPYGQLGDGTTTDRLNPVPVSGGIEFAAISTSAWHTCGLTAKGVAWCWGRNLDRQLGDGTSTHRHVPTAVVGGLVFASIAAGRYHTCGLDYNGSAFCWGSNWQGQYGNGTQQGSSSPVPVSGGLIFAAIAAGGWHTCGLTSRGAVYCWGNNELGQLGDDNRPNRRLVPYEVSPGFVFTSIAAGARHTCAVVAGGAAYCWGFNQSGQLGDGTTTDRSVPTAVARGLQF